MLLPQWMQFSILAINTSSGLRYVPSLSRSTAFVEDVMKPIWITSFSELSDGRLESSASVNEVEDIHALGSFASRR